MIEQLTFTPAQVNLMMQLLETERRNLHPEIHHTQTPQVKDELNQRLRAVEELIRLLQESLAQA